MRLATSQMSAVEAMRLAVISAELGRALRIPTQAYLAFSSSKLLDAQAGAETAVGAVLAALSGVDQVAGPGMLDELLAFSLPKLVLDAELCLQARHLARDVVVADDLPTLDLARELLTEGQLMIAASTGALADRAASARPGLRPGHPRPLGGEWVAGRGGAGGRGGGAAVGRMGAGGCAGSCDRGGAAPARGGGAGTRRSTSLTVGIGRSPCRAARCSAPPGGRLVTVGDQPTTEAPPVLPATRPVFNGT
jgi:hypothetical protein